MEPAPSLFRVVVEQALSFYEDEGIRFLRKFGTHIWIYTVSQDKKQLSSYPLQSFQGTLWGTETRQTE
jgi:hypothetical protein